MHAALLAVFLLTAAPPQTATAGPFHAAVADFVPKTAGAGCLGAGRDCHDCARKLWKSAWGWVTPVSHTGYAPGTLRDPSHSWYKHSYLAFRGNYYVEGYDYLRQFDYPWHQPRCPSPGMFPAVGRPSGSEEIPAPPEAPSGTARATRSGSAPTADRKKFPP